MTSFTERTQELLGKATIGPFIVSGVRTSVANWGPDTQVHRLYSEVEGDVALFPCGHNASLTLQALADATLISHLVNSAPALVELVKAAVDCRAALLVAADRNSHAQNRALKGIIAALAKLEGGQ